MKKLAVIILNWNGLGLLRKFIPDAVKYTSDENTDLFVADNGSSDGSIEWLKKTYPEVGIIELERNYGFAEGYNRAIRATAYPFTILLNSDVEVTPGWTVPLLKFMESTPDAGACQPKILDFKCKSKFEYAGAAGGLIDRNGFPYCRGRILSDIESDKGQYDMSPQKIAWASGAALMVRTPLYIELGGLDPEFFAHMEEIDLCCRMAGAGFASYAVTESKVYHVGGASLNYGNPKKTYLNFRNNLLLLHKNLPKQIGKRRLIKRRLIDTIAILAFFLKFDMKNAIAIIKAHRDFSKMRKSYTDFPGHDYMSQLPGADRNILIDTVKKIIKRKFHR